MGKTWRKDQIGCINRTLNVTMFRVSVLYKRTAPLSNFYCLIDSFLWSSRKWTCAKRMKKRARSTHLDCWRGWQSQLTLGMHANAWSSVPASLGICSKWMATFSTTTKLNQTEKIQLSSWGMIDNFQQERHRQLLCDSTTGRQLATGEGNNCKTINVAETFTYWKKEQLTPSWSSRIWKRSKVDYMDRS